MFPNDPQMVLFSGKIRKGEYVYLHKLPFNGPDGKPQFVQGGNSREFHSIPGVEGIKPIEIKEIPVNKYLNLIRKATPADLKLRKKYMKKQGVAEGSEHFNQCYVQACKVYDRAEDKKLNPVLLQVAGYKGDGSNADKKWLALPQRVWQHYVVVVNDTVYDPTAKQFGNDKSTKYSVEKLQQDWDQQYQIRPKQDVDEAHPNSKIYDQCWDGYKKVPGKKRGEKGSCVEESSGYIPRTSKEAQDPRWSSALTHDVTTHTMRDQIGKFFPTDAPNDGQEQIHEAEYHGREVPLGRPMRGDVKKFKVYVKDPSTGNVKKVNFGDPNMRIKKSNPARRRSFRARHNCKAPGPRTKARYWSCRKW
jgi:hypothetical protein